MNKILQSSKKLFKFTISRAFFLCLGIGLALVVYKIQAAVTIDAGTVIAGNTLTAGNWNAMVQDLNDLNGHTSHTSLSTSGNLSVTGSITGGSIYSPGTITSFGTLTASNDFSATSNTAYMCSLEIQMGGPDERHCPAGKFMDGIKMWNDGDGHRVIQISCCYL